MKFSLPQNWRRWVALAVVLLVSGVAWGTQRMWWPPLREGVARVLGRAPTTEEHAERDHAAHARVDVQSIPVSPQARRSLGLKMGEVALTDYRRTISIPAIVTERPGRTATHVAAPLTGVVTSVNAVRGEAVESGTLLFKLRLTHEDLVQSQTEFLRTLGQLDVEKRELERLQKITSGAVAGKVLLEKQYAKERLEADLQARREALLLHGLSEAQADRIAKERKLLREMEVRVPVLHADNSIHDDAEEPHSHEEIETRMTSASAGPTVTPGHESLPFVIETLSVQKGQAVTAGEPLCTLVDFRTLYVEGHAFEQDAEELVRASRDTHNIIALLENGSEDESEVTGLSIVYVANEIDTATRTLSFFVALPNTIVRDEQHDGRRFLTWRFKPGQRMQLRVPVESWTNSIVLPVEAVTQDGLESFVFIENGDKFVRRPVHVQHRDQTRVVLANDGSIYPGEPVALNAAHQLQMAIKNQSGGGVDPHAGHNH